MDSDKWLEFTIFTGIDKYKAQIADLVKKSKRVKDNFYYMKLISEVYMAMEILLDEVRSIV